MNIQQIKLDVDFLSNSTSATYTDTNKVRNINISYQDVARLIWTSAGGWQYDDSNATTLPIAKTTLVHNQQDYTLPSTAQRVHEVVVKDNGGLWSKLSPIDLADISVAASEYLKTPGLPLYYDTVGRSVMLYPPPHSASVTLASGIAFYVDRDVTEFSVSATTTVPGFATAFHRILSYAAAIDFIQDEAQRTNYIKLKTRLEQGLTNFYSKRSIEYDTAIKPAAKQNWRQYT